MKRFCQKMAINDLIKGTLLVSALLTVSCKKDEATTNNELSQLKLELNTQNLSTNQLELSEAISKNANSSDLLLTALIEKHRLKYQIQNPDTSLASDAQTLSDIESLVSGGVSDLPALKVAMENALREKGELLYNKDNTSFFSYLLDQRMQCYSGTTLFEVLRHKVSVPGVSVNDYVVILEPGHVLPGYMVRKADGFHLVGIETTVNGRGLKEYGSVNNLRDVRVVDADFYMATEVFEGDINNESAVMDRALEITAQRYGIPLQTVESELIANNFNGLYAYQTSDLYSARDFTDEGKAEALNSSRTLLRYELNMSIFQFGSANVSAGDQARSSTDNILAGTRGSGVISGEGAFIPSQEQEHEQEDIQYVPIVEIPKNPEVTTNELTSREVEDILFTIYNKDCRRDSEYAIHVTKCKSDELAFHWNCKVAYGGLPYFEVDLVNISDQPGIALFVLNSIHPIKDRKAPEFLQILMNNHPIEAYYNRYEQLVETGKGPKSFCPSEGQQEKSTMYILKYE